MGSFLLFLRRRYSLGVPIFFTSLLLILFLAVLPGTELGAYTEAEPIPYLFNHLSRESGLAANAVSDIEQDSHGFLWFATQSGLSRYDGTEMKGYRNEPYDSNSLPHNQIQCLTIDDEDVLWIGTYHGLSRFDPSTETFTNYEQDLDDPRSLSNDVVTAAAKREDGKVWVGTLKGLNLFDPQTQEFGRFFHDPEDPASLSGDAVRSILVDSRGDTWVGGYAGLDRYDRETGDFHHFKAEKGNPQSLLSPNVMRIYEEKPGVIWLACWGGGDQDWPGGLTRVDTETGEIEQHPLPATRLYDLAQGSDGIFWAADWGGGLVRYNPESREAIVYRKNEDDPFSLCHNTVYSLLFDRTGLLWIGTNGNGANMMDPDKRSYGFLRTRADDPKTLAEGKINAVLEDSSGEIWVGSYNGGLNRYSPETGRMRHYRQDPDDPRSLSHDIVTSIYEDSRERIWVTTNQGLNRYDPETDSFECYYHDSDDPSSLSGNIIYQFLEDDQGRFWVGTYNHGLDLYSADWQKLDHFEHDPENPLSLSNNMVYSLFQDRRGRVWVGTNKGLNRYLPGANGFRRYLLDPSDTSSLSNNTIRDILEDSRGRLWIATMGGGINRYYEETDDFSHRRASDGLSDNGVTALLEDDRGDLWAATKYGISIYHPREDTFTLLQEEDGLLGTVFTGGRDKLASGDLIFGTAKGLNRFPPQRYVSQAEGAEVLITDCLIFNESRSWEPPIYERDRINLQHGDSFVSFEFAALDYHNPDGNRYAYQLEGVDEEWIYSGNRDFAHYTNLQPGLYTFRVKASPGGGEWTEEPAELKVRVEAPPWRSPGAYVLYVLFLLGFVYLLTQWRAGVMLRQQVSELQETRAKLEEANRKLSILSIQDPLTGINNRRRLDDLLRVDWKQAGRSRIPLAALMIDIDFFKAYNDFHGHQQGDECLQRVAEILVSRLERGSDYAARYGGEEFCVILHDTDLSDARLVADRLRRAVEEEGLAHGDSPISTVVTISVGVASWIPAEDQVMETLIAEADRCLYRAKAHGRNRVESTRLSKEE